MARWEHFPHQSDIGVRGVGASPAEAFEQAAALALIAVMSDPASVQARESVSIRAMPPISNCYSSTGSTA